MSKVPATTTTKLPVPASAPSQAAAKPGMRKGGRNQMRRGIGSPMGNMTILLVMVVLGILSYPTLLVFCCFMLPSGVAYLVDRHRRWALTFTVLAPNLAATGGFVIKLLMQGATLSSSMDMLSNPFAWCMTYMAAAFGWGIFYCMPMIVTSAKEYRLETQRTAYEAEMKRLKEEWGADIDPPEVPATQAKNGAKLPAKK